MILQQNSQISSNGATITGSVVGLDVQVSDFSIANLSGTIGPTFCEPGQSSGTSCP